MFLFEPSLMLVSLAVKFFRLLGTYPDDNFPIPNDHVGDVPILVEIRSVDVARMNMLRDLSLLFKVEVDGMLDLMGKQGGPQDRQPLVSLEPSETSGGLQHGGPGPA